MRSGKGWPASVPLTSFLRVPLGRQKTTRTVFWMLIWVHASEPTNELNVYAIISIFTHFHISSFIYSSFFGMPQNRCVTFFNPENWYFSQLTSNSARAWYKSVIFTRSSLTLAGKMTILVAFFFEKIAEWSEVSKIFKIPLFPNNLIFWKVHLCSFYADWTWHKRFTRIFFVSTFSWHEKSKSMIIGDACESLIIIIITRLLLYTFSMRSLISMLLSSSEAIEDLS